MEEEAYIIMAASRSYTFEEPCEPDDGPAGEKIIRHAYGGVVPVANEYNFGLVIVKFASSWCYIKATKGK